MVDSSYDYLFEFDLSDKLDTTDVEPDIFAELEEEGSKEPPLPPPTDDPNGIF